MGYVVILLYSIYIPQIIHNITTGKKRSLPHTYMIGMYIGCDYVYILVCVYIYIVTYITTIIHTTPYPIYTHKPNHNHNHTTYTHIYRYGHDKVVFSPICIRVPYQYFHHISRNTSIYR